MVLEPGLGGETKAPGKPGLIFARLAHCIGEMTGTVAWVWTDENLYHSPMLGLKVCFCNSMIFDRLVQSMRLSSGLVSFMPL